MSLSDRVFILDKAGSLFRLPSSTFSAMMSRPDANPLPRFASQRIRAAEAIVELLAGRPSRVVRLVYFLLQFDEAGVLDTATLMRQAAATFDAHAEAVAQKSAQTKAVVEATSRLTVRGGRWTPTPDVDRAIRDAALGRTKCPRV